MKEEQLREMIRSQIKTKIKEDPDRFSRQIGQGVSGRLGGARSALDRGLAQLNVDKLARLNKTQKIDLLVGLLQNVGINSGDFRNIQARVSNALKRKEMSAQDTMGEAKEEFELQKAKGGVTSRDLGGASAINRAKPFLSAIKSLSGNDKNRAIGYVLSQMGVDVKDFESMKSQLKTSIRKYK
jgi:hypothetical protein